MSARRLIVGVTGGIAAYKTAFLVSRLVQRDCQVQVVQTEAAKAFVGPTTFAALTGRPVATDAFQPEAYPLGAHIELARWGQLLCIAPATADFLAQAAAGTAHDLLSTLYLCFEGPVVMAPAMNDAMWQHAAVQRNVRQLEADGVHLVGPEAGWLSCRRQAVGRMAEPDQILERVLALCTPDPIQA